MKPTDKDWERARDYLQNECCWSGDSAASFAEDVMGYAATVRRETVEECAKLVESFPFGQAPNRLANARAIVDRDAEIVRRIRALLDEPKADYDPTRSPIVEGDFNGPHGPVPEEDGHG